MYFLSLPPSKLFAPCQCFIIAVLFAVLSISTPVAFVSCKSIFPLKDMFSWRRGRVQEPLYIEGNQF